ncbi:hypothetical protein [Pontibacter beigongshangensis]|uniref:hypothetical protein n=1 Tax=Pontibacter beigongshangensis TaxID=2574733 RepID=UPI001F511DC8|nr:hypothetical protein [Pontibacter beigongshangensis]
MKGIIRPTFVLFLTLCILLGSVGVALSETLCHMVAFKPAEEQTQPDSCCQKAAAGTEADDCCTEELTFEKLEPVSAQKTFQLDTPALFPLTAPAFALHRILDGSLKPLTLSLSDSSPPRAGRQLLHFIHILII